MSKRKFYLARFARIYPLHFTTLIISIPLSVYNHSFYGVRLSFNILLLQSFVPLESFYTGFNAPSWSISNEIFFYALFPFFIPIASMKKTHIYLLALLLVAILAITIFSISPESWKTVIYYNPFTRFFDFLIGILLFGIYKQYKNNIASQKVPSLVEILAIIIFLIFFHY